MVFLLLAIALQQQPEAGPAKPPEVMLGVDRDRVTAGDMLTFTVHVATQSPDPIQVDLPTLDGFELESRSERSDVMPGPSGGRTTTIRLELRAMSPGEWHLGPVTVHQGPTSAQSEAVAVTVEGGGSAPVTASLSSRLSRIVQHAPPPDALGQAGISVVVSDPDVLVGQQVDVVTLAWFERGLRQQLRRAPTVESPTIDGVWSYPQPVPGGIAATRQVAGKTYDLFVLHQVVFPLTPGRVAVSPARLQYSVPLAYQFFSQEESYKIETPGTSFLVRALPADGRDPGFAGAVGHNLVIAQSVDPVTGRQGEAFSVEVKVEGEGNVALWPAPDLVWPASFRVYPQAAEEQLTMRDGRLSGIKTFHFLLVADSAGALSLPPMRYAYFDLVDQKYKVTQGTGTMVIVAPRDEAVASRAAPPPMRLGSARPLALALREALPGELWFIIAIAPALFWVVRLVPRRSRRRTTLAPATNPLRAAELRLAALLGGGALEPAEATEAEQLLARIREARFGGASATAKVLTERAEEMIARLRPRAKAGRRRWRERTGIFATLALCVSARVALGQTSPEAYYNAGAYRAAADGFRQEALAQPDVPAHWYNLGDAAYRAGDDAAALAAWVRAGRLAPRDGTVRRALLLVAPADQHAGKALWIAPVSPDELWLFGIVAWLAGWGGAFWSRRMRGRWSVLLGAGALLLATASALDHWYRLPTAVVRRNEQLRLSPHELSPAVGEVAQLGTVRLLLDRPGWVEVDAGAGQLGWMPEEAVQSLSGEPFR